ncbi:hypothetical protein GCM10010297_53180 [Streptomyces malachitofuscus]|nr:hypothetical protein GCM10010297_53180 [Streptomyces malachitofuscus]
MTDDSEAAARAHAFVPVDDVSYARYLRANMVRIGALSDADDWQPELPKVFGESLPDVVDGAVADLIDAFTTLGRADRLSRLVVKPTASDEISARYIPCADGSGLVLLSDSFIGLCNSYCQYMGKSVHLFSGVSLPQMLYKMFIASFEEAIGQDPAHLTSQLRYHLFNRRAHGIATILATPRDVAENSGSGEGNLGGLFLMLAIRFVIGHEMAHHVLGHVAECAESPDNESEADLLALEAGALVLANESKKLIRTRLVRDRWLCDMGEFYSLLASSMAMLTVQSMEDGLMVRRGRTHLPARDRAARLAGRFHGEDRLRERERVRGRRDVIFRDRLAAEGYWLELLLRNMLDATTMASDFGENPANDAWTTLLAPETDNPHGQHMRDVARLDRLLSGSTDELVDALHEDALRDGALLVVAGDTRRGLSTWGVPDAGIAALHDAGKALAFHKLVHDLRSAFAGEGPEAVQELERPLVAATLLARALDHLPGGSCTALFPCRHFRF